MRGNSRAPLIQSRQRQGASGETQDEPRTLSELQASFLECDAKLERLEKNHARLPETRRLLLLLEHTPGPFVDAQNRAVRASLVLLGRGRNRKELVVAILSSVLGFLVRHRFALLPVCIAGAVIVGIWAISSNEPGKKRPRFLPWLLIPLGLVNVLCGPRLNGAMLYRHGRDADAVITSYEHTGSTYNDQEVLRYHVAIRPPGGEAFEGRFESMDFNVYPSENSVSYPSQGETFTVRFIPGAPENFVIVADDGRPYARRVICDEPLEKLRDAARKLDFEPRSASFRASYDRALREARQLGCDTSSAEREETEPAPASVPAEAP